jgi:hypothetical protein
VEQVEIEKEIKKIAHSLGRIAYALEIISERLIEVADIEYERNTQED